MISRVLSRYIAHETKKKAQAPAAVPVSDPPPRWTYYHTFGDEVWVRKGREAKQPVPYTEDSILAGVGLPTVSKLIGKGRKGLQFLESKSTRRGA